MTQQTMIDVKSDPDVPEAVVVCKFGQVNVLFGAVDEGVGFVVVALWMGPQVNFGVVVRIVVVVTLDFDLMFVGHACVVDTLWVTGCHVKASIPKANTEKILKWLIDLGLKWNMKVLT